MDEILTPEHREKLIERFTNVARADILTAGDALAIVNILGEACNRASAELEEMALRQMIDGDYPQ